MILLINIGALAQYAMCRASLYIFWQNLSRAMTDLFWERFACNHGYTHNDILGETGQTDLLRFPENSVLL